MPDSCFLIRPLSLPARSGLLALLIVAACGGSQESVTETTAEPDAPRVVANEPPTVPECVPRVGPLQREIDFTANVTASSSGYHGITEDSVQWAMSRRMSAIRSCYVDALYDNPGLSGELTAVWDVNAGGRPACASVRVEDPTQDTLAACVRQQIVRLQFDRAGSTLVRISYPITFSTGSQGGVQSQTSLTP